MSDDRFEEKGVAAWFLGEDWDIPVTDEYCLRLGRIVVRLQVLETLIRLALQDRYERTARKPSTAEMAYMARAGDSVGVFDTDYFASYDTLSKLIAEFNGTFVDQAINGDEVVSLRDAIAHGRLVPLVKNGRRILKLVKFSKIDNEPGYPKRSPQPRITRVEFSEELTSEWLTKCAAYLDCQLRRVREAAQGSLPPLAEGST